MDNVGYSNLNEDPTSDIKLIEIKYTKVENTVRTVLPTSRIQNTFTQAAGSAVNSVIIENISEVIDLDGNTQNIDNIKMDNIHVVKTNATLDNLSAYKIEARLYNNLDFTTNTFQTSNNGDSPGDISFTAQDPFDVIIDVSFEDNITQQFRNNGEDSILYFDLAGNMGSEPWHKSGRNGTGSAFQVKIKCEENDGTDGTTEIYTINPIKKKIWAGDNPRYIRCRSQLF